MSDYSPEASERDRGRSRSSRRDQRRHRSKSTGGEALNGVASSGDAASAPAGRLQKLAVVVNRQLIWDALRWTLITSASVGLLLFGAFMAAPVMPADDGSYSAIAFGGTWPGSLSGSGNGVCLRLVRGLGPQAGPRMEVPEELGDFFKQRNRHLFDVLHGKHGVDAAVRLPWYCHSWTARHYADLSKAAQVSYSRLPLHELPSCMCGDLQLQELEDFCVVEDLFEVITV
jgi:hypothetical protein